MTSAKIGGALAVLVLAGALAGCKTASTTTVPATASVAAVDPAMAAPAPGAPGTAAVAPGTATATVEPAKAGKGKPAMALATVNTTPPPAPGLAAMTAPAGVCTIPIAEIPPVPSVAGSLAGSVGENAGRNVARSVGTGVANTVVASVIPGFGAVVGQAVVNQAGAETIKTAEDLRGSVWTATDGKGCGCNLEFAKPGMVMTKKIVTTKGCRSPLWTNAARWNFAKPGIGQTDLVFLGKDNKTVLAKLDMKSRDYYQGSVNGEVFTIWRK